MDSEVQESSVPKGEALGPSAPAAGSGDVEMEPPASGTQQDDGQDFRSGDLGDAPRACSFGFFGGLAREMAREKISLEFELCALQPWED
jgi:hypothetical protein